MKIKNLKKNSGLSKKNFFFALQYIKNLTKVVPWKNSFCSWKKIVALKKTLKFFLLVGPTVKDFNSSWFWLLRGSPFHPVVVIYLGKHLLLKSVLGHCLFIKFISITSFFVKWLASLIQDLTLCMLRNKGVKINWTWYFLQ